MKQDKKFDNYTIKKVLGEGGFGITYLARDHIKNRDCVLKKLSIQNLNHWKNLELFEREAKILANLNHVQIPNFYDYFTCEHDNQSEFYLVQEFIPGKSLLSWVQNGRRFQEKDVINIALQIVDILSYLHRFSPPIIHRDIKPANIILNQNDKAFLIDFGSVRDTIISANSQEGSTIVGTFGYMPMEQFEGRATPASDLYALGMTIIYLLAIKPPSEMEKKGLQIDYRPHVKFSSGLSRIIDKLIAPDVNKRYQSSEQLKADLKMSLSGKKKPTLSKKILFNLSFILLLIGYFVYTDYNKVPPTSPGRVRSHTGTPPASIHPWRALSSQTLYPLDIQSDDHNEVWVADYNGLTRYRGKFPEEVAHWSRSDIFGSGSAVLTHMTLLPGQEVWLSNGDHQLRQYSNHIWNRISSPQPEGKITALSQYKNQLLIAINSYIWQRNHQTNSWKQITRFEGSNIWKMKELPDGRLLVATDKRVWQYKDQEWSLFWHQTKGYYHMINTIHFSDKHILLGTKGGVIGLDLNGNVLFQQLKGMNVKAITGSLAHLWVGTETKGLQFRLKNKWYPLAWKYGFNGDHIDALTTDSLGNLWCGINNHPLLIADQSLAENQIIKIDPIEPVPVKEYVSLKSAITNRLLNSYESGNITWKLRHGKPHIFFNKRQVYPVGTAYHRSDGKTVEVQSFNKVLKIYHHNEEQEIPLPQNIQTLTGHVLLDRQDRIWLTPFLKPEIYLYQNNHWKVFQVNNGILAHPGFKRYQSITHLKEDKNGQMVMGLSVTYDSEQLKVLPFYQFKNNQWEPIPEPTFQNKRYLFMRLLDSLILKNTSWYGTGYGLAKVQNEGISWLIPENNIPANTASIIPIETHLLLLHGSTQRGISLLNKSGVFSHINSRKGLFADFIKHATIDKDNHIWLMNNKGRVGIYSLKDLLQFSEK